MKTKRELITKQRGNVSSRDFAYLQQYFANQKSKICRLQNLHTQFSNYREYIQRRSKNFFTERWYMYFFRFHFFFICFALSFYLLIFPFFYFSFLIFVIFNFLFFESFLCFLSSLVFISFHFAFWNEAKWKAHGRELV